MILIRGQSTMLTFSQMFCEFVSTEVSVLMSKVVWETTMWSCGTLLPGRGTGEWEGGPKWLSNEEPGAIMKVCTLKVGDVDYGKFRDDDPPPFYDIKTQRYDRTISESEKISARTRCL